MTDTKTHKIEEFVPIDDATCERILARGKYIYDCRAECEKKVERFGNGMPEKINGMPVDDYWDKHESVLKHLQVSIKCDRCNTKDIESSFNWNGYDLCLPCAGDFRKRTAEENRATKDMVKRELSDYSALSRNPSSYRETHQLISMIFGMTRNILPDAFWNIPPPDTYYLEKKTVSQQFDSFIVDMARRFVDKFGEDHLAKCFNVDLLADPMYGDDKLRAELFKDTTNEPNFPGEPEFDKDWGTPNSAWDNAQ
jgi:hypothetical protein